MKKTCLLILFTLFLVGTPVFAQNFVSVPFDSRNWDFGNSTATVENYMGKQSYRLDGATISTKNVQLRNGTIEVDINFPNARFFPGVLFRLQDRGNAESFYVRPHQSGNPDATQYTPFFNGYSGWQLYHGEGHSAAVNLTPDVWHRIKIDILNDQADIYFDDMETPLIKVTDLKRDLASGEIGLSSGAPVYFSNLRYSKSDPVLVERDSQPAKTPQGLITEWSITDVVSDEEYRNKLRIDSENLVWTKEKTEASGTINLAKFIQSEEGKTTVLAKIDIESDSETLKKIDFGYSDFVWIYVNGDPIYSGRNEFMSRDYRYLGTIGWFDSAYLPLKKGSNEVLFVVGENFGGWGIKAKIEDMEGIEIR